MEALDVASKKGNVEEEQRSGAAAEPSAPAEVPAVLSPGGVKRKEAEAELDELSVEYEVWQEMDSEAEKALAVAQRIYDAKVRRIDGGAVDGSRKERPAGLHTLQLAVRRYDHSERSEPEGVIDG